MGLAAPLARVGASLVRRRVRCACAMPLRRSLEWGPSGGGGVSICARSTGAARACMCPSYTCVRFHRAMCLARCCVCIMRHLQHLLSVRFHRNLYSVHDIVCVLAPRTGEEMRATSMSVDGAGARCGSPEALWGQSKPESSVFRRCWVCCVFLCNVSWACQLERSARSLRRADGDMSVVLCV